MTVCRDCIHMTLENLGPGLNHHHQNSFSDQLSKPGLKESEQVVMTNRLAVYTENTLIALNTVPYKRTF